MLTDAIRLTDLVHVDAVAIAALIIPSTNRMDAGNGRYAGWIEDGISNRVGRSLLEVRSLVLVPSEVVADPSSVSVPALPPLSPPAIEAAETDKSTEVRSEHREEG